MDHDRFLRARTGDMLCSQFQCDYCWFINLKKREPREGSIADAMLMPYIRRVNLDMLWSREESTVYNNFLASRKKAKRAIDLGLTPIAWARGPWPVGDKLGFQTAIEILHQSQEPGRNVATYQQFDSIRKFRTADFNEYESSVENLVDFVLFGDNGKIFKMSTAPTQSRLFTQFMKGCEKRMGRVIKQNRALSIEILKELLHNYNLELLSEKTSMKRKRFVKVFRGYLLVSFAGALRGGEGFMIEATSLCKMIDRGRNHREHPYVLIPLMGRFKSENGERNVLLALANESKSGLKIREVVESWVELLIEEGRNIGALSPAVCHEGGFCISRVEINKEFLAGLDRIKKGSKRLISRDVDIENSYNIYRSMRRGATSRATAVGLTEVDINMNNRWRKFELARGARPNLKMHELYTDITLAIESHVRFSYSL